MTSPCPIQEILNTHLGNFHGSYSPGYMKYAPAHHYQIVSPSKKRPMKPPKQETSEIKMSSLPNIVSRIEILDRKIQEEKEKIERRGDIENDLMDSIPPPAENKELTLENATLIINNIKNKKFSNEVLRGDNTIHYHGQSSGIHDHLIVGNQTLYIEKSGNNPCVFIGLVTDVKTISERTSQIPALYELSLDKNYVHNNIKSGDILHIDETVDRGRGSYCYNKSAAIRLGFSIKKGNFASGIINVQL